MFLPFCPLFDLLGSILPLFALTCGHLGTVLPPLTLNLPQKGPTEEPKASKASPQTLKFIEKHTEKHCFRENLNFRPEAQKAAPKA